MKLYIIRHAQSTNNVLTEAEWNTRDSDPPLTALGEQQAEVVARHLAETADLENPWSNHRRVGRGYGIDHLYCSPMARALQTAQPVGDALGLNPEVWVDIHEQGGIYLNHGEERGKVGYPGKSRGQMLDQFPSYILPDAVGDEGWWTGDYEDLAGCHRRVLRVAEALRRQASGDERIALVTHGTFIDVLLKALVNQLPDAPLFFPQYNTAITRIDFRPDGHMAICYLNKVGHLPAELVS
ncbi:MAG: histidine phosphatase family protein [Chloroflexi bacterium]|nr:histidine phosphatase family protein [Chloroflexota bacterium]